MKTKKQTIEEKKMIHKMGIYGCKTINLGDGTEIHVHMANNSGRGTDNVTLTRVPVGTKRPTYTRQYQDEIISQVKTSGWRGRVNFSRKIREQL